MKLSFTINGKELEVDVNPNIKLMDYLRSEGYYGVKDGCDEGNCGSCVILLDGKPRKSCLMFVGQINNHEVTTIEGLGDTEHPHPLQDEFVNEAGIQCGYCIPGMILSANALLLENPNPSETQIKEALNGNLCRCTGYVKQIKAVKKAAKRLQEEN